MAFHRFRVGGGSFLGCQGFLLLLRGLCPRPGCALDEPKVPQCMGLTLTQSTDHTRGQRGRMLGPQGAGLSTCTLSFCPQPSGDRVCTCCSRWQAGPLLGLHPSFCLKPPRPRPPKLPGFCLCRPSPSTVSHLTRLLCLTGMGAMT